MNVRLLLNFIAVVDRGSVCLAAQSIGVTPQSLSAQVAVLETELGAFLLHRSPTGVTPTEAGQVLYRHACSVVQQLEIARDDVRRSADMVCATVVVGMSASAAEMLAVPLLQRLRGEFPGIRVQVMLRPSRHLEDLLLSGRVDLALNFAGRSGSATRTRPVAQEELYLVSSCRNVAWLRGEAGFDIRDIATVPLLMPPRPHSVRLIIEDAALEQRTSLNLVAELDSSPLLLDGVIGGLGSTVMPWSVLANYRALSRLHVRPFREPLRRMLGISFSRVLPPTKPAQIVENLLDETISAFCDSGSWRGVHRLREQGRVEDSSYQRRSLSPGCRDDGMHGSREDTALNILQRD